MLSVRGLSVGFRRYTGLWRRQEVVQLSGLDFDLSRGEVLAVVGASGAGKSLLAHAILGLLPPNAVVRGQMRIDGAPILPSHRGRTIALMPQQITHMDPTARAGVQIDWAARRVGARSDVPARLAALGLSADAARLFPRQLSGGMARRVMLAMAGAGDPALLIADEPTAGLDPQARATLLRLLRGHAAKGAVMMITHDLAAALGFADRVLLLDAGRICSIERARDFSGDGAGLRGDFARALWRALPQNGFVHA